MWTCITNLNGLRQVWRDINRAYIPVEKEPRDNSLSSLGQLGNLDGTTGTSLDSSKPFWENRGSVRLEGSERGPLRTGKPTFLASDEPTACPELGVQATPTLSHKPRILIARPKPVNRNDKIRQSLERAYPRDAKEILDQAYAAYYYTRPASQNLPELYELLESGFIDQGLEACGLGQWAIGRPRDRP